MNRLSRILFAVAFMASVAQAQTIPWQPWSSNVFAQAKREHKFILLDLGTQWCHWCHVMDVQTYADAKVQHLIAEKFIPVKVDADSRPDLSDRYEDYGWPATVVFNANGGEIVKRQGYLEPAEMASMLQAIIDDPTPGPSVVAEKKLHFGDRSALTPDIESELIHRHTSTYDTDQGAWGHGQKFLDAANTEWAIRQAARGDAAEAHMATQTLAAQLNLLDPAWGGVYQYSTDDDWHHPHFEKIMQMQTDDLRIYALAYAQWKGPTYLTAAQSIHRYLTRFLLGDNGAFFTSQDADLIDGIHSSDYFALTDAQRTAQGIPRIDRRQYARENGWAIRSLTILYEMTGDESALREAQRAADWICDHRAISDGGFSHDSIDASDPAGPYLGDTLAMGQAFLELYAATGDRTFLSRAQGASDFIARHFTRESDPGVMTSDVHIPQQFAPQQELQENIEFACWANLLSQYSGRKSDDALAHSAMRYLATPAVALQQRVAVGGILLANDELGRPALHITVVGPKLDVGAITLFRAALAYPSLYKRTEWYDPAEGSLPNSDVIYPHFPSAAGFVCTGTTCSRPAFTTSDFQRHLSRVKN